LQELACPDCPVAAFVQRGEGVTGPVLTVIVRHDPTCPWFARCVPADGATLLGHGVILRHEIKAAS
jgi:hypothetical protein